MKQKVFNYARLVLMTVVAIFLYVTFMFCTNNVIIANNPSGETGSSTAKVSPRINTTLDAENPTGSGGPGASIGDGSVIISNGPGERSIGSSNTIKSTPNDSSVVFSNEKGVATKSNIFSEGAITFTTLNALVDGKPTITSDAAILVNLNTQQIYASKNEHNHLAPASLTNLVTAYLLASKCQPTEAVVVSKTAVSNLEKGANNISLVEGDTILVEDLLHAMILKSACDSANVAAEKVSGSIENFVALMNETVKNWGCKDTNFVNPSGLNNDNQYTSAYDMAIIFAKIQANAHLMEILKKVSYVLPKTSHRKELPIESSCKIINKSSSYYDSTCVGGKQGYTSKALYTLACGYDDNGTSYVTVILRASSGQNELSKKLYEYGKKVANETGSNAASQGKWVKDSKGWYYEKKDGSRAKSEWITVNGVKYCVDSNGYMITGWREFTNGNLYYFDPQTGALKYNTWVNTSSGAYFLQADGSLAKAEPGKTKVIETTAGKYVIDENGKAISKAQ